MASLFERGKGSWVVEFTGADRKRRTVRLGSVTKRQAESTRDRVEAMNTAVVMKQLPDADTARWVADLPEKLAKKLAAVGLIQKRTTATLGEYTQGYIDGRSDIKPRTRLNLAVCRARLVEFFGV